MAPRLHSIAVIVMCFANFVHRGRGTPAPYDPPQELVVTGLYRHIRNPQYVGALLVVFGESLLTGRAILIVYATCLAATYHVLVTCYEERTLRRQFGDAYVCYCESVPRWLPRR